MNELMNVFPYLPKELLVKKLTLFFVIKLDIPWETEGFPGGSVVKHPPALQEPHETRVQSRGWEDPLKNGMTTHSNILAWRIPIDRRT